MIDHNTASIVAVIMWSIVSPVFAAIATSGITAAVVTALLKRGENVQVHEQSKEIEELKSSLRRVDDRTKTQFDWMHQERAKAAVEISGLIVDVDLAIRRLLQATTHGRPSDEERSAYFADASKSGDAFRKQYSRRSLLLPESVINELQEFDDLIWQMFILASVFGRDRTPDDRIALANGSNWQPIRDVIVNLRASLREALGDVAEDAKKGRYKV